MPVQLQTTVRLKDRPGDYLTVEPRKPGDDYPDECWAVVHGDDNYSVWATPEDLRAFAEAILRVVGRGDD